MYNDVLAKLAQTGQNPLQGVLDDIAGIKQQVTNLQNRPAPEPQQHPQGFLPNALSGIFSLGDVLGQERLAWFAKEYECAILQQVSKRGIMATKQVMQEIAVQQIMMFAQTSEGKTCLEMLADAFIGAVDQQKQQRK